MTEQDMGAARDDLGSKKNSDELMAEPLVGEEVSGSCDDGEY